MELKGLATGIGSLPHKDAQAALDLIFQYIPHVPFWPQLPKRDKREGMVAQFSENIPFLKVDQEGLKFDSLGAGDFRLEEFYEKIISNDIEHFKISADFAFGLHKFYQRLKSTNLKEVQFIKCHVTGPFTFAASIKDDAGNALLYNPVLMQAIIKALVVKSLWQIKLFQEFGKKIILFIDEPYLGCFGSAYTPLNRADVVEALREITEGIKQSGDVLTGLHCCGNTDWSIFTEVKTIDIISFDAFEYLDRVMLYADNLKEFTSCGGILCWGIVPTQSFSKEATPELLAEKINGGIDQLRRKGLDGNVLLESLMLSPSCGLGTFEPGRAQEIFELLSLTSSLIKKS
ncbi:MAG: hypothetical protein ABIH19_02665 [Candidatus Omnitrophota bacterium]